LLFTEESCILPNKNNNSQCEHIEIAFLILSLFGILLHIGFIIAMIKNLFSVKKLIHPTPIVTKKLKKEQAKTKIEEEKTEYNLICQLDSLMGSNRQKILRLETRQESAPTGVSTCEILDDMNNVSA